MHVRWQPYDWENWERKLTYLRFLDYFMPYLVIGANLEVGAGYRRPGVYLRTVHCVCRAANDVMNFRLRIRGSSELVLHERVHPSFTLPDGDESFAIRRAAFVDDLEEFQQSAGALPTRPFAPVQDLEEEDHWLFLSCTPWIHFTHVVQPVSPLTGSIPRILWGKEKDGLLPITVQVHHGLMDAVHIGRFLERLERYLGGSPI